MFSWLVDVKRLPMTDRCKWGRTKLENEWFRRQTLRTQLHNTVRVQNLQIENFDVFSSYCRNFRSCSDKVSAVRCSEYRVEISRYGRHSEAAVTHILSAEPAVSLRLCVRVCVCVYVGFSRLRYSANCQQHQSVHLWLSCRCYCYLFTCCVLLLPVIYCPSIFIWAADKLTVNVC